MKRTIAFGLIFLLGLGSVILASNANLAKGDAKQKPTPQRPTENPEYLEAKKQPHWCGTNELWEMRKAELGLHKTAVGCPLEGVCDDPTMRDGTVIEPLTVRVIVHVMGDNQGYVVDQATVDATIDQMNADYSANGTNIQFQLVATRYHRDRKLKCISACNWGGCSAALADIARMKSKYAESPQSQCNIYISCQDPFYWILLGVGTFPWDPDALTEQGGIWLNSIAVGAGAHTATHEMGHNLGLWHTHHGVSEVAECGDCYEFASGFECDIRGDFACDTPPTPTNYECSPPGGSDCQGTPWGATQPENYMGYGPDDCITLFTGQQTLRKQCWTKDALSGWLVGPPVLMHVDTITVTRELVAGGRYRGVATVRVVDQSDNPVSGAAVEGVFTGPTSGSKSGTTDANGEAVIKSKAKKNPSGEWCYEVTDVIKSGATYDPGANVVTKACESGPVFKVFGAVTSGRFVLGQAYPNPFNPETDIRYTIPADREVRLEVYNLLGQKVVTLVDEHQSAGVYNIRWNAADVPSGVYFYRITAGEFTATNKMILMK
ncbi:MAG: T9SS type A sorting domain-containing protein [bacterium]